ncbi:MULTISPECIES: magnesium and cobalt transport protein CorA [Subtercola]|uniref:Magnesium and cobalt transport protein CorA n=1 Tax=Subtercola vilae TaxID=2056433 RepID=A0A4T2BS24_9MICO|nr:MULTISPECIES: magnesium and cobalt transport protein CorA [Subtercola]MEA9987001.1 magnesium and cobalt transport protein CorA [Subtercola sp. RTI3]TIH34287.1 magnesium and cobalt transport protein CorA [Subtercola vilae]
MTITDNAVYVDGRRTAEPKNLDETFEVMRANQGVAWIDMNRPDKAELQAVADELSLHHLAVTDALTGHQRAKLERYGETLFIVLRPAKYLDDVEKVQFGEVHLFLGPDFVVSVNHFDFPDIDAVRRRLEAHPDLLAEGTHTILYGILDLIVDDYAPVLSGLENDIDEIEDQIFSGDRDVSRRIYDLLREVISFQRATTPLEDMISRLVEGLSADGDLEIKRHFRDVLDHVIRLTERADSYRSLLENGLTVHSTLIAQKQNDEMTRMTETSLAQGEQVKKISSWAAVLFAPTLVAAIYGMNFTNMPELKWFLGYPFALALMLGSGVALYFAFKKRGWL